MFLVPVLSLKVIKLIMIGIIMIIIITLQQKKLRLEIIVSIIGVV